MSELRSLQELMGYEESVPAAHSSEETFAAAEAGWKEADRAERQAREKARAANPGLPVTATDLAAFLPSHQPAAHAEVLARVAKETDGADAWRERQEKVAERKREADRERRIAELEAQLASERKRSASLSRNLTRANTLVESARRETRPSYRGYYDAAGTLRFR